MRACNLSHTMEDDMFHPQASFYPQNSFYPQGNLYPQGGSYAQGGFQPQNIFNPQGSPYSQGGAAHVPFANTLYGFPQQTPAFSQGLSGLTNWQQAALQQLAAQQLGAQIGVPNPASVGGAGGSPNGVLAPSSSQQPHLLQQLAQYHYLIAQQLAQLAAQQALPQQIFQGSLNALAGQFIPGMGTANFVPGITMH
jgi:hypothetical protein